MPTVGQALQLALAQAGVRHVFGIPGVHTVELFRGIGDRNLELVVPRHEQGAGFMADGYARASGRPGVCWLITGPGVTNAITPVAQAFHDSVPLLVVASETAVAERGRGQGPLHDLPDQRALMACVTGYAESVAVAADLPAALSRTWAALHLGRARPVYLGLPHDLLGQPCPPLPALTGRETLGAVPPADADLDTAAELLARADRPVIVLGGGAVDAGAEAARLAEVLDAPVALTGNAKGAVPSSHPLNLGATLAFRPTRAAIAAADVVLLVGTQLSSVEMLYSGERLSFTGAVVRVDIDPGQLGSGAEARVGIVGQAGPVLAGLADRMDAGVAGDRHPAALSQAGTPGRQMVATALAALDWTAPSLGHLPWLSALDGALPVDRIVALDSAQLAYTAQHALPVERPRSWLAPYAYGTLGPALPMAIGAKVARPDAPAVVIVGDGGLLFTVAELATAVDRGLNLPVVVWDNHGYGEIRDSFRRAGIEPVGCDTTAHDIVAVAAGFGCAAARVGSPAELGRAVARAFDLDRPTVISVAAPRP
jgi:acetolactate synthase-1/2/3 large subunit